MRPRPPSSTLFPYTTLFRSWMPGRIDEHHPVLVVKVLVTLHHDHETGAVLEGEPSAPVRKDVRIHACRRIERRAHALAGVAVPRALFPCDVDPGQLPDLELGEVRAAAVAARDERRACLLDLA